MVTVDTGEVAVTQRTGDGSRLLASVTPNGNGKKKSIYPFLNTIAIRPTACFRFTL